MAQSASDRNVFASQRKLSSVVIELRAEPLRGVVAQLAILREPGGEVIRIISSLVVLQMARRTGRAQSRILAARMALGTGHSGVFSGERELGGVVIEGSSQPPRGGVTELAGLRETGRQVIGAGGGLVILQMAGNAIGADVGVVAIGVALQARDSGVSSGEWELGQVVVECGAVPGGGVMAGGAITRKSCCHVVGVGGPGEIREVTARAIARDTLKVVADMTSAASQILVRADESEMGKARMIEVCDLPAVRVVTGFAGGGESRSAVVQNAVLLKLAGVTSDALGAESDVLADRRAHVTGVACERCVRTNQRETIPVVLDGTGVHAPAQHRVTVFALRAELALVEIRMTIRASRASFGKDFRYVARITRYILVHAPQLEMGFGIMIEFGLRAKRRPTGGGVTILAWQGKLPMRVRYVDLCDRR